MGHLSIAERQERKEERYTREVPYAHSSRGLNTFLCVEFARLEPGSDEF